MLVLVIGRMALITMTAYHEPGIRLRRYRGVKIQMIQRGVRITVKKKIVRTQDQCSFFSPVVSIPKSFFISLSFKSEG